MSWTLSKWLKTFETANSDLPAWRGSQEEREALVAAFPPATRPPAGIRLCKQDAVAAAAAAAAGPDV